MKYICFLLFFPCKHNFIVINRDKKAYLNGIKNKQKLFLQHCFNKKIFILIVLNI